MINYCYQCQQRSSYVCTCIEVTKKLLSKIRKDFVLVVIMDMKSLFSSKTQRSISQYVNVDNDDSNNWLSLIT